MFERYCDYCHKPIAKEDYLVHLRHLSFNGISNEYYHLSCYNKLQTQIADDIKKSQK